MTAKEDPLLRILCELFVSPRIKSQLLTMAQGDLALASLSNVIPDLLRQTLREHCYYLPLGPKIFSSLEL